MNTQWIKRTEREPSASDFPIAGGAYILGGDKQWDEGCCQAPGPIPPWFTHWRSIKCDPPPRELTQRELDDKMAMDAARDSVKPFGYSVDSVKAARFAIYAERREFRALLSQWFMGEDCGLRGAMSPVVNQLRARCDEQGQGK